MGGTGPTMEPGADCPSCHNRTFSIAGTVYPTAHEPDACDGVDVSGASVTITDAKNNKITLTPNTVGNFYSSTSVTFPITAEITYKGLTGQMTTPQMSADCNSCHSVAGANGAPGRIVLP
ncbi:MAG: hypothetical protein ABSC94_29720 [Polyangiaceae bacterium]